MRLERFYAGVLGLPITKRDGTRSVWLDAGGVIVMLEQADDGEPPVAAGSKELVAFTIAADEHALREAALADAGVDVEARTPFTMYVRDPDGRRVGLTSYPVPRT